jgi:metal-dependent amidase/aminoacylase/carboxypeptidase family protein
MPWNAIDPVTTSALVITGLQTVVTPQSRPGTASPAVITIGRSWRIEGQHRARNRADDRHDTRRSTKASAAQVHRDIAN